MSQVGWKKLHACVLSVVLAASAATSLALVPVASAVAQVRSLPDFTEMCIRDSNGFYRGRQVLKTKSEA